MSTTSLAIFSNPLFATYSVYARNASVVLEGSRVMGWWLVLLVNDAVIGNGSYMRWS